MYVIVCVLLADSMHGRSKFASIIRFGGCLDVGQQCERERRIPMTMPYVALHQIHVDTDLLVKVECVVDYLE